MAHPGKSSKTPSALTNNGKPWTDIWNQVDDDDFTGWVTNWDEAQQVRQKFENSSSLRFVGHKKSKNFDLFQGEETNQSYDSDHAGHAARDLHGQGDGTDGSDEDEMEIDEEIDNHDVVNDDDGSDDNDRDENEAPPIPGQRRMPNAPEGWSNDLPDINVRAYTEQVGPKCNLAYDAPELDYLMCLIGDDFFEMIARNTNINAASKRPPVEPDDRDEFACSDPAWTPTNKDEIKAFISINILMGINHTSEYQDCWSNDPALRNEFVSSLMTKNRYEKLSQYLHCSNVRQPVEENDKVHKVSNFIKTLQRNFPLMFVPGQSLSVDEAMIKFNGRLSWKQYMPPKPTKWGIKLWCLCDSVTGYCLAFQVYTGRAVNQQEVQTFGLGYTVVMGLMREFLLQNHIVYADNFFSSIPLVEDLLQADTCYCGTLRKDRVGVPRALSEVKLDKYDNVKWAKDQVMLTKWKDKRDFYTISTSNDGSDIHKPRTRFQQRNIITIPSVIAEYNAQMGGVDHADQLRSYYNVGRTGRWWKYLFWGLLNVAIINAYILWEVSSRPHPRNRRSWSLKSFKMALVHQLGDGFSSLKHRASSDGDRPIEKIVAREPVPGHSLVAFAERKKVCRQCKKVGRKAPCGDSIQTKFG
ncbi:piggyBac transposable element-derived protein 4-like [Lytechinus variegatus]|uniref:piggyBac transposable element-derived protein 4-like n=1 Tax=Lytechinus variegatus TaxID=7654 RepID=UPI001BB161E2|nr:piggyBac transposable element-derived protein 4-like [Lytechinus variegatus]